MESADEVFALRVVHPGFAADGGIHLRQQGGRDLQAGDAALVAGSGKACNVANDAAAKGDDEAVAVVTRGNERIEDARPGGQRFVRFAIGQAHGDAGFVGQRRFKRGEVVRGDGVVGDDADLSLRRALRDKRGVGEQAVADVDGVVARRTGGKADVEGVGGHAVLRDACYGGRVRKRGVSAPLFYWISAAALRWLMKPSGVWPFAACQAAKARRVFAPRTPSVPLVS